MYCCEESNGCFGSGEQLYKADDQAESYIIKAKKKLNKLKRDAEKGGIDEDRFNDAIDEVIWELREVTSDIGSIEATCNLIKGQMYFLSDLPETIAWAKYYEGEVDEVICTSCQNEKEATTSLKWSNKDWVEGIVNGLLDLVKDYVLEECYENEDEDECGDEDYLCDDEGSDFWVDLATCYLDEDYVGEIPMRPTREDYKAARKRWIHELQQNNPRIKALVDYKVNAEHALALILTMEFSDPEINELPRSQKLVITIQGLWERLFKDLYKQLDNLRQIGKKA